VDVRRSNGLDHGDGYRCSANFDCAILRSSSDWDDQFSRGHTSRHGSYDINNYVKLCKLGSDFIISDCELNGSNVNTIFIIYYFYLNGEQHDQCK
jgi:hypothetical protein